MPKRHHTSVSVAKIEEWIRNTEVEENLNVAVTSPTTSKKKNGPFSSKYEELRSEFDELCSSIKDSISSNHDNKNF